MENKGYVIGGHNPEKESLPNEHNINFKQGNDAYLGGEIEDYLKEQEALLANPDVNADSPNLGRVDIKSRLEGFRAAASGVGDQKTEDLVDEILRKYK